MLQRIPRFSRSYPVFGISVLILALTIFGDTQPRSDALGTPLTTASSRITEARAMAIALNDFETLQEGYRLQHPRHTATFTPDGMRFTPRRGGPAWHWRLDAVNAEMSPLAAVKPVREGRTLIRYHRGDLIEQYRVKTENIEQQFVLTQPLALQDADLVITGTVESVGAFEKAEEGWLWRTAEGVVSLGDVTVYDATGQTLPAEMTVTEDMTRIVVPGPALALATYPVTVDPEVGTNDFRISHAGLDGNTAYAAFDPAVAYNSAANEYLVVWEGEDDTGLLVDGEFEIFGQRLAADGTEIGVDDFRISDMGPDGDPSFDAYDPAVAYNSTANEYLVVWEGDFTVSEDEIFGQRLASDGTEIGVNDFRISDMGPDGNAAFDAHVPTMVYNNTANEYLVIWNGDDDSGPLVENEEEIFGQRLASDGTEVGVNDFRISDMGPDGNTGFQGDDPAAAYNSTANEYLVVWEGDDNTAPLVDGEYEIYGQRLASDGTEVGVNDFLLSDMGPDGNDLFDASNPVVAYNSLANEYLVVWQGEDDTGLLVDGELEIFGQRLAADGTEIGVNDFRISDMGPDGNASFDAASVAVAYNSLANEYLVVWRGDDDTAPLVDNAYEAFGQRLASDGTEVGVNDFRISDMGPDGNTSFDTFTPAMVYNSSAREYLVAWYGDDDTGLLVDGEYEIYGQRLGLETDATLRLEKTLAQSGETAGVEVTLESGIPVGGVQFRVTLGNPAMATFVQLVDASGSLGFTGEANHDPATGVTQVIFYNDSGATIPSGAHTLGTLQYTIDPGASLGSDTPLAISQIIVGDEFGVEIGSSGEDGALQVGIPGDINLDGTVNIQDVVQMVRILLLNPPPAVPDPGTTPYAIADVNGDGALDVADVVAQVNQVLHLINPRVLASGPVGPVGVSLSDAQIQTSGGVAVPLMLENDGVIAGLQAALTFDPALAHVGTPTLTEDNGSLILASHVVGGKLRVVVYSATPGTGITAGHGAVLHIPVTVREGVTGHPSLTLSDLILVDPQAQRVPVLLGETTVTVAKEGAALPTAFTLQSNAPNPFNPSTQIAYEIPQRAHITLTVYNLLGQEVVRLVDKAQAPGRYRVTWHGTNARGIGVSSGVYLYRLTSSTGYSETKRMTLVK